MQNEELNIKVLSNKIRANFRTRYPAASVFDKMANSLFAPLAAFIILKTKLTPNYLTSSMGILGILGAICYIFASPFFYFVGLIFLFSSCGLDNIDGEVARYKKASSDFGMYFDYLIHQIVYPSVYFCAGFGIYLKTHEKLYLYLGILWVVLIQKKIFFLHVNRNILDIRGKRKELNEKLKNSRSDNLPLLNKFKYEFEKNPIKSLMLVCRYPFIFLANNFHSVYFVIFALSLVDKAEWTLFIYPISLLVDLCFWIVKDLKILNMYDEIVK